MSSYPNQFSYEDLLACAEGDLFGPGNGRLPKPPMLMLDRITNVSEDGGSYGKGELTAELDVHPDQWFFKCHFKDDPVMPGCLGLDALWQLLGFYLCWTGAPGRGRALGVGDVRFTGQVLPDVKVVTYQLNVRRILRQQIVVGIADGQVLADGQLIYAAKNLRVGLFASGITMS